MRDKPVTLKLRLFGLRYERNGAVRADVLANKLKELVKGLQQADRAVNGAKTVEYLVTDLEYASATLKIDEYQHSTKQQPIGSGSRYFHDVATSVLRGERVPRKTPRGVLKAIAAIGDGTEKIFSHGEIRIEGEESNVIRIDDFFDRQADRALAEYDEQEVDKPLFAGSAFGTFDGVLKEVDLRGSVARARLVLTAGGIEIDCVCNSITVENLREALDRRVVVTAQAIYDGESRLPKRLDLTKIQLIRGSGNLSRWTGAFEIPDRDQGDIW